MCRFNVCGMGDHLADSEHPLATAESKKRPAFCWTVKAFSSMTPATHRLNTREKRGRVSPHFAKNDCSLKMVDLVPPLPFLVKKVLQFILPQLCALPFSILYLPNSITLISIPQLMTTGPCTQSHNRWDFRIKTDWHSWLIADIIEPNKGSASVHGRLKLVQLPESSGVSRPGSGPSSFSKP